MISDLGLTVVRGADGIAVFVRSLATAETLEGVRATLLARNNEALGTGLSDAAGRVTFDATIAKGDGGRTPAAVLAHGAGGDFAVLDLGRPAFDLGDRGVGGRAVPGPLDAFVYADRGVFRPGETANITVLLRDEASVAVERFPLTLRVLRPNGTVFRDGVSTEAAPGLHVLRLPLTRTAPLGTWSVLALADPEAEPIGRLALQVEEFVPERLAVELAGSAPSIQPTLPFELTVRSRFLYGPPAAGLDGSARVLVARDPDPYPMHPGFRFGLAQDDVAALSRTLPFAATDAAGVTRVPVTLPPLPDTTVALKAAFEVAVQEPGGRPTRQSLTVPVRQQPFALGLRPLFDGDRAAEDGDVAFELIAVDGAGTTIDRPGLSLELFEERWVYQWYVSGGSQNYRTSIRSRSLERATVAATAAVPLRHVFAPLPHGRYRLEVGDPATGVATSVRFSVGWQVSATASESPDTLDLAADRPAYRPGETARIRITPPFAGEALVTVATDRVLATTTLSVPAEGATVDLPVTADWGVGAYVTATVYRPPVADRDYLPVRALGLAWLPIDPAERTLTVALPEIVTVRPRQRIEIPVSVTDAAGAPATEAHVTLAAVDEGILQLTRYASPDPAAHYLGKRRLGVDIRDDYSRLIAALSGPLGALRQGGDQSLGASLADVPLTIVSLFAGPVAVGPDGIARISLEIPDFNGELRLMAVAADRRRVGSAARPLAVRDPLVADLVLPRFLAPGDESRATVALHNVEAAAGLYRVAVAGTGAVAVADGASEVRLERGARTTVFAPLTGVQPGRGTVRLSVRGPDGFAVERELSLTVRTARPVLALSETQQLAPGAVARFGADRFAPYLEGTAAIRLTFATRPPIDVAGLLAALDRYPHGCLEQVVSRALPLLAAGDLARAIGEADAGDVTTASQIERAIGLVLDMQRYDGAFGVWSGHDAESPWLTAYALEFLTRARQGGQTVPMAPYTAGLTWLQNHAVDGGTSDDELASRAYALHVLALAEVPTPGALRYFADAFADRLPTPLARGQLAAALLRFGDEGRATGLIDAAVTNLARDFWHVDYGSTTRDAAALIRLLADVDRLDGRRLEILTDRLPTGRLIVEETNTQEKAWIVMAAGALFGGDGAPEVRVTGTSPASLGPAQAIFLAPTASEIAAGVEVANAGSGALWQAVAVSGVPAEPLPAAAEGLKLRRSFHTRTGEDVNVDALTPGEVFVLVLRGQANTGVTHQALLTHALPAGWEIESARLGDAEAETMPWLGALTPLRAVEARDDRFVAAIDLTRDAPAFRVALLVRVVTPGAYELPGAVLEDMYRPRIFARQGMGRITIAPAD
jgi:alpha-2-macroglobulin